MRRFVSAALWIGAIGTFLLIITMAIPSWLAREDEFGTTHLIGLFYRLECNDRPCKIDDDLLNKETVPLKDRDWGFNPSTVPIMIIIACILCSISLLIIECLDHKCCWRRVNNRPLVAAATVLLILGGILGTIAFFIACRVADEYYADNGISSAVEFPWAMLIAVIALIMMWISIVMFVIIVWKWYKYGSTFDQKRVMFLDQQNTAKRLREDDYVYTGKYKQHSQSFNQYGNSGYATPRYGSNYSNYHRSRNLPDFEQTSAIQNHSPEMLRDTVIRSEYGARTYASDYVQPELYISHSDPYLQRSHSVASPTTQWLYAAKRQSISDQAALTTSAPIDHTLSKSYKAFVI